MAIRDWNEEDGNAALTRRFSFADFREAMAFMIAAGDVAEDMQHHPEWSNVYNRVDVRLTTHDAGNTVTEKDRALAAAMDEIYEGLTS